ncbi:MAG: hypothetical protein ACYTHJ_01280, partial [Planctomycetota bacterium]
HQNRTRKHSAHQNRTRKHAGRRRYAASHVITPGDAPHIGHKKMVHTARSKPPLADAHLAGTVGAAC